MPHLLLVHGLLRPVRQNPRSLQVFFPQLGSSYGIRSWLKTHVGLDPKKIERMFKVRSRWVVLDQHAPNWCLSEHLLYVV